MDDEKPPRGPSPDDAELAELMRKYCEQMDQGAGPESNELGFELLSKVCAKAQENPTPEMQLGQQAAACEEMGDWAGALEVRRERLRLAQASAEPEALFSAHRALARFHRLTGDGAAALDHARRATEAARRIETRVVRIMALHQHALEALRAGCVEEAEAATAEAFAQLHDLTPGRDLMRAKCHSLRAQVRLAGGNEAEAEADLNVALPLFELRLSDIAAGVHASLARCFSTRARIAMKRGDPRGAIQLWQFAVARERHVAALPQVEQPYARAALAEALRDYAGALKESGDEAASKLALAEADSIRREIGLS